VLAVGVAAAAATGALAIVLLGGDSGADEADAPIPTVAASSSTEDPGVATTTTAPARPEPTTTTTAPPSAEPVDQWIAVLSSVEQSVSPAEADERHAAITSRFADARRLDSNRYASLRPGFWVSYVGPFPSGEAAVGFCRSNGLAVPSNCYGRFLSHDPADQDLIVDS